MRAPRVLSASGFVNVDETRAPINQANNRDWLADTGGTASSPTGPPADHTSGTATGKYLYLETSSPCSTQTYETNLLSPVLDIDTLTVPTVEFWYHLFGEDIGELHVDVLDATGAVLQLDVIPAVVGDQGDAWIKTPAIDLTPFQAGNTQVIVRIRGLHLGASFLGDAESLTYTIENLGFVDLNVSGVAIVNDNNVAAQITTPPAAVVPAGMTTTFDVSFSATAEGAFGFDVEVGSDDTDEGTYVITVSGTAFDPDGGSGGAGGGTPAATTNVTATTTTTGAGGSDGSGGGDGNDNDSDDDGGCGCRVPNGRGGTHPTGAATLLVLGVAMVRRRRRRSA
ncbi:MAG: MYXO-CTERM sorting domain-containing protein [Myxococcota bacterium]